MTSHAHNHSNGQRDSGIRDRARPLTRSALDETVASLYARARKRTGLSQEQVALRVGRSGAAVAHWENPLDPSSPSLSVLVLHPVEVMEDLAAALRALEPHRDPVLPLSLHGGNIALEAGQAVQALCCPAKTRDERRKELLDVRDRVEMALRALDAEDGR